MKNEKAALLDIHAKISLDRTKNLRHVRGQLRALEMGLKNRYIHVIYRCRRKTTRSHFACKNIEKILSIILSVVSEGFKP